MRKIFVLLVLLSGCNMRMTYEDVSGEPEFKEAVGARYEVIGSLDAYGIRPQSKASVDYVTLIPPPGIDGLTVAFRESIRPGSTITVKKVYRTNRWFANQITLGIELAGTSLPANAPAHIDLTRGNEGDTKLELNPAIYRKLADR